MNRNLSVLVGKELNKKWFEGSSYILPKGMDHRLDDQKTIISEKSGKATYLTKFDHNHPDEYIMYQDMDLLEEGWENSLEYVGIHGKEHTEPDQFILFNVMNGNMYKQACTLLLKEKSVLLVIEELDQLYTLLADIQVLNGTGTKELFINKFDTIEFYENQRRIGEYNVTEKDKEEIKKGNFANLYNNAKALRNKLKR